MKHNLQRAKQITIIFWIMLGLTILSLVSDLMQLNLLNRFSGGFIDNESANANDIRQGIIALFLMITVILAIVFFIMWFRRAYYNLHQLGIKNLSFEEGWAAGSWFVPILNLVRPYQIMKEVWLETQRAIPGNAYVKNANLVGWWWALYLISNIYSNFSLRISMNAASIDELINASIMSALGAFIDIPAILAVIFMIQETSAFEEKLFHSGTGEPDLMEHLVEG